MLRWPRILRFSEKLLECPSRAVMLSVTFNQGHSGFPLEISLDLWKTYVAGRIVSGDDGGLDQNPAEGRVGSCWLWLCFKDKVDHISDA